MHVARSFGLRISVALLALILGAAPVVSAQDAAVRGKVAYDLGYGYENEELVENGLSFELNVEKRLGFDGKVYVGFDGLVPAAGTTRVQLREAYADLYLANSDWRIGRQVISWGTADGLNPTNVINPRGPLSTASLSLSEGALKGEPLLAVQGSYYLPDGGSLTAVGVAEFVPAAGAGEMLHAIAAEVGAQLSAPPLPVDGPDPVPADGSQFEWAVRGETLVGGHNVYVSYFRGWDDYPAAWLEYVQVPVGPIFVDVPTKVAAAYRRVHKFGLATAGTLGDAGVWTELSYTLPEKLDELDGPGALSSNEGYVEAVVGGDYTFPGGVTLSAQVIYSGGGSLLTPYKEPGADVEPQAYVAGIARYSPEPGHTLEGIALANIGDGGIIAAGRYTYDILQVAKLTFGVSHVFAGKESEFGALEAMANLVTVGVEVSFQLGAR